MSVRVLVFAKAPVPGFAKTRLIPALGTAGAAELQATLIHDTVERARQANVGPVELWGAGADDAGALAAAAAAAGATLQWQRGADLGQRMQAALAAATAAGAPALIIGTDCPALSAGRIRDATAALADHDAVVNPAHDGGYVLLGLHRAPEELFRGVLWGTEQVLAATRSRLVNLDWSWYEPPPLGDIDCAADLATLAELSPQWRMRLIRLGWQPEPGTP